MGDMGIHNQLGDSFADPGGGMYNRIISVGSDQGSWIFQSLHRVKYGFPHGTEYSVKYGIKSSVKTGLAPRTPFSTLDFIRFSIRYFIRYFIRCKFFLDHTVFYTVWNTV